MTQTLHTLLNPTALALVIGFASLSLLLFPEDLKIRLVASWRLFWPPWQDRSMSGGMCASDRVRNETEKIARAKGNEREEAKSDKKGRTEEGSGEEKEKERLKEKIKESAKRRIGDAEADKKSSIEGKARSTDPERMKRHVAETVTGTDSQGGQVNPTEKNRLRGNARLAAEGMNERTGKDQSNLYEGQIVKEGTSKKIDATTREAKSKGPDDSDITQSERARQAKDRDQVDPMYVSPQSSERSDNE
jgi:hypothetical protein